MVGQLPLFLGWTLNAAAVSGKCLFERFRTHVVFSVVVLEKEVVFLDGTVGIGTPLFGVYSSELPCCLFAGSAIFFLFKKAQHLLKCHPFQRVLLKGLPQKSLRLFAQSSRQHFVHIKGKHFLNEFPFLLGLHRRPAQQHFQESQSDGPDVA